MPAGSTYTPIATTTLGSAAASYTFSSIPSTYTDLVLIVAASTVGGGTSIASVQFNGDTAANYSCTRLSGNGSSASSDRDSSGSITSGLSYPGQYTETWIFNNYANTTTYKTSLNKSMVSQALIRVGVGLWRSTAAINSIKIIDGTGTNYAAGSTFTLYGIASA